MKPSTEDFDRGDRVKINIPGHHMHGMIGTVTGRDFYTGNGAFRPEQLEKV